MLKKKTIIIAEGKNNETVTEFATILEDRGGSRQNITDVGCDMSPAFIKGGQKRITKCSNHF